MHVSGKYWGDCEDMAILAAAMVKYYAEKTGEKLYPLLVLISGRNSDGRGTGHAFTVVLTGRGEIAILDPAAHQITGKDYIIWHQVEPEPVQQAIREYLKAWRRHGTVYTKVDAVLDPWRGMVLLKDASFDELVDALKALSAQLDALSK